MVLNPVALDDPHVPAHNAERDAINALQTQVDNRIPKPGGPTVGSLLRWDGVNWLPTKMKLYEGNGSPEGVVAAPVGSRYVDATAAGGISEYFKQSGVGNTGWAAQTEAIGWTNLTVGAGYTQTTGDPAQACMVSGTVYFRGTITRTSGSGALVGTLAAGLAPVRTIQCEIRASLYSYLATINSTGAITISSLYDSGQAIYLGSCTGAPYRRS